MAFFVLLCFLVGLVTIFIICPIQVYKLLKNGGVNIGTRRVNERGNSRDFGGSDRDFRRDRDRRADRGTGRDIDKYSVGADERRIDDLDNNEYSSDLGR